MNVIIVGAGASGLMCAYKLKEKGHDVTLLEKNLIVGKKIYITGKGRCNLTNDCSKEEFIKNVVSNPKFLYSAINTFSCQDTMTFFESIGVPLTVERGHRVFPASMKAKDIPQTLFKAIIDLGVNLKVGENVRKIIKEDDYFKVITGKNVYIADKVVIATGGLSYPDTGSTGDGYMFAELLGHSLVRQVPALCALKIEEDIPKELYKFTQKNVKLYYKSPTFSTSEFGELTFYKEGLAGPIALTISSQINRGIPPQFAELWIDFKPALTDDQLDKRIIREIQSKKSENIRELLRKLLPGEILNWFIKTANIKDEVPTLNLSKGARQNLVYNLKHFKLTYLGLDNIERATVTAGGISVNEINSKTMESKRVPGLYFIGEVIDVDAYTGGFNLQIAFSTAIQMAENLDL